jgi:hypothetical protein
MASRALTLGCALAVVGALASVIAADGSRHHRDDLVVGQTDDGIFLRLSKARGVAVLFVDGARRGVRRHAPYTFFVSDAVLKSTILRHRIVIRDGISGELLALRYIRRLRTVCRVDSVTMIAPGCTVLREDTASVADPEAGLWGEIGAVADSRHQFITSGGDTHPKANGAAQHNGAFRRLTVQDGDDFYGERAELGRNWYRDGENRGNQTDGTFALYREGERKITFFSMRLGSNFRSDADGWQVIMQMKQAQPYGANGPIDTAPALTLELRDHRLVLVNFWKVRWTASPPSPRRWIRYALDVTYSQDPAKGKLQLFVDRNGDGDSLDTGEISPVFAVRTLAYVTSQGLGSIQVGGSIPGHLRLGVYHDESAYGTTSIDVDNVQVVAP